ncbi:hypothetical protein DRQ25_03475 [Candidatus Fermentibacteria bacterium]|nr:MAG: hypothetical protein DRQ25_03475 [Candidatus Fermentibacteria bacterium]
MFTVFLCVLTTVHIVGSASEVLFSDDFSSGELESNWILYGDPQPRILDSLGVTPPCFNNNGDSMFGSGVFSREVFKIGEGLRVECDMYLECAERGTWVTATLAIVTPDFRDERTQRDFSIARMEIFYSGELDWGTPHRQCVLQLASGDCEGVNFRYEQYHQNQLLNNWHTYCIEINEDRLVTFFINDSLIVSSPVMIPDTVETVRIQLGNRSSDWGIALHDNLVVYRP